MCKRVKKKSYTFYWTFMVGCSIFHGLVVKLRRVINKFQDSVKSLCKINQLLIRVLIICIGCGNFFYKCIGLQFKK